jgi:signal transduction histidine kinase
MKKAQKKIWKNSFQPLKIIIFYLFSSVAIIGTIFEIYYSEFNSSHIVFHFNYIFILVSFVLVLLFYYKIITINIANGIIVYLLLLNIYLSQIFSINMDTYEAFFLRDTLVVSIIIPFAGFIQKKITTLIICTIHLVFYLVIILIFNNSFLESNFAIILLLICSYTGLIYYIFYMMEKSYIRRFDLINKLEIKNVKLHFQKDELHALNEMKDKIFSIVAHDLKNPFNSILLSADLLKSGCANMEPKLMEELIETITISTNQANNLLNNLLEWSRCKTKAVQFKPSTFNISELIEENVSLHENMLHKKNIQVKIEGNCSSQVQADIRMIGTVLRNLISNALKYTYKNGQINIKCEVSDKELKCSVSDSGMGIPKKQLKDLFKEDSQITTKGTEQEGGTGLGLILCHDFIQRHQGKIWAESEPGKGATFHFTIPQ